jgi:hypothetical protein
MTKKIAQGLERSQSKLYSSLDVFIDPNTSFTLKQIYAKIK